MTKDNEMTPGMRESRQLLSRKEEDEFSLVARSEMKRTKPYEDAQLDSASPNQRQNQPRMSQDFKMRILTKKKVAVPASASSHDGSRHAFN